MKSVLRIAVTALLVLAICLGGGIPVARAAEGGTIAEASIPVTVTMKGDVLPESDTVSAEIAAVTENAPMPEEAVISIVCRNGEGSGAFRIEYPRVGVYQYTVTVRGGDYYLAEYGEDLVCHVTVSVVNNVDFSGYEVRYAYRLEGQEEKCGGITDCNEYLTPMELTVVKKWIDQDSQRPDSIRVELLCGGKVVEGKTLVLSSKNGWQGSWDGLDPRLDWSVSEAKVPAGYTVSYRYDSGSRIWYITNTGSLLQTGQLNWPIPALASGGIALLILGVYIILRRKETNA